MGLIYQFPIDDSDSHYVQKAEKLILIKSYGLPKIFWIYGGLVSTVLIILMRIIYPSLIQLWITGESLDKILVASASIFLLLTIIGLISAFYIQFHLEIKPNSFSKFFTIFGMKWKIFTIDEFLETECKIHHFLGTPNLARINKDIELKNFENKGYFELIYSASNQSFIVIDRSSRKDDLIELKKLINQFLQAIK